MQEFNSRHARLKNLPFCVGIFALFLGSKTDSGYDKYCNARFNFCVDIPNTFKGQGESMNGDGQTFISKDAKAEIKTFGGLAIEDFDKLSQRFQIDTIGIKVAYKIMKSQYFIISGTNGAGKIIYQKTIKKQIDYMEQGKVDVFQTLMITYPTEQNNIYSSYCSKIAKSL